MASIRLSEIPLRKANGSQIREQTRCQKLFRVESRLSQASIRLASGFCAGSIPAGGVASASSRLDRSRGAVVKVLGRGRSGDESRRTEWCSGVRSPEETRGHGTPPDDGMPRILGGGLERPPWKPVPASMNALLPTRWHPDRASPGPPPGLPLKSSSRPGENVPSPHAERVPYEVFSTSPGFLVSIISEGVRQDASSF